MGFKGRTALVVGASKGLGLSVADRLQDEGCRVVSVARSFKRMIGYGVQTDLMKDGEVEKLAKHVLELYPPDIIYYCIGGSYGGITDWKRSASEYSQVWRFNLGIAIDLNNLLIPHMLKNKWGRIVMTSTDGTKCNSGNAPYTSSKFALEGYVKTASKQLSKDNVILSAVAPGHVYTEGRFMYSQPEEWTKNYFQHHAPIGRWAADEEIANMVVFQCSEKASYMAGSIVRVDGGSR